MVSVPDWARFSRMLENRPAGAAQQTKYLKQRELETIRQAEEQGYFLNASKSFIENTLIPKDDDDDDRDSLLCAILGEEKKPKDLMKIQLLRLTSSHLRNVGDIGLCENLSICILNDNYIQRFDGLACCTNLFKLDLHGNQISTLPGTSFWSDKMQLRLLHLHDNPISKIENLASLSACPCLFLLTLFDTPLSLKRNYRHHVVNSLWSLKALDNYVISDEEIIEDAKFDGPFAALSPMFLVNICPQLPEDACYEEERDLTLHLISQVNNILAHSSPVLLIQRYIRGFLTRRRYKLVQDMRIWAAVTIQRSYREYKGIPNLTEGPTSTPPPPTSPTNAPSAPPPSSVVDSVKIDYDTYLQNRRPGSTAGSEASMRQQMPLVLGMQRWARCQMDNEISAIIENLLREGQASDVDVSKDGRKRKNIYINLTKLQSGTLQSLQDEAIAMETVLVSEGSFLQDGFRKPEFSHRFKKKKDVESKRKIIKSVKQFFGPVVNPPATPEGERKGDDEDIPVISFRLRGIKQSIEYVDPMSDMIMARREVGHEVRLAESNYHRKAESIPKPVVQRRKVSDFQRFAKMQGNMGLSCLRAVQQAYKDRSNAERTASRLEKVMRLRDQRESGRERTKIFHDEKRKYVLAERDQEHKRLLETAEKKELAQLNYFEKKNERKTISSHFARQRKGELTFVGDFNVQNTSVSNALMRHDRQAQQEDKLQERADLVVAQKQTEREQQDIVRKYLEHRQLMRQTESAMARSSIDTRMLQEANDRLMQARSHVAQQKARHSNVQNSVALPNIAKRVSSRTPNEVRWSAESNAAGGAFLTQPPRTSTTVA